MKNADEILAFFTLALATGMRKSEILEITASEVFDGESGLSIVKRDTKNGTPRTIYLSAKAEDAIKKLMHGKAGAQRLFSLAPTMICNGWRTARDNARCPDLRLHDLRHEAISRMADAGMSIGALSSMSGHKTSQMLMRYVNASEADIRAKLALAASRKKDAVIYC